ncbi:beta-lactamase [Haliscomenobacter hydrossis DSM 1100]|uniref:Beta-lactamase n=1 Tax=Haliscomenobacter hydrossis (strain ATCC 27775 / DSM 1100 / LMG 10767 / O) TaxID=760192 RepID=F4L5U4_HALH1|nr:beta-lactamase [Haliscomenobacter hydrossis DSM 1100]
MKHLLFIPIVLGMLSCSKQFIAPESDANTTPISLEDQIKVGAIRDYILDTSLATQLSKNFIHKADYNIHSLLIYKNDALFYEQYRWGKDEKRGKNLGIVQHNVHTLHDVRSISKSVVSACIGIAIQKGLIKNVEEPINTFFPELCTDNDEKSRITIKNLLTMSSGLCWEELGKHSGLMDDETKMDLNTHPVQFVLSKKMNTRAGTIWNYSGGNTQVLAEIIKRVSGKDICAFAKEHLFNPLGIMHTEWTKLSLSGEPAAASGLRLTSRDLLKLGILYNDSGIFNKNPVIDSRWVEESLSDHIKRPNLKNLGLEDGGYGFQFWTYGLTVKNRDLIMVEAKGNGGQSIMICPDLSLILVMTAGNYGKGTNNTIAYTIMKEYVLPAIL